MAVLISGGMGYIGSHTAVELLNGGYEVVIADNLCNSKEIVKERIEKITGKTTKFYNVDLTQEEETEKIFKENKRKLKIVICKLNLLKKSVDKIIIMY